MTARQDDRATSADRAPADQTSAALQRAVLAVREMRAKLDAAERARTEPIAVIGMGCRLPGGANSPDDFWELLRDGVDAISEVPADRWDGDALYDADPSAPGRVSSRWGGFLDRVDGFDAGFFGISPREADQMDPQQRIMLEVAWEAFEQAGQTAERLAGSPTGVFVGVHSHSNDYTWLQFADPDRIDTYSGTGTSHSVVAGRISYLLDLRGPSVALDTACSSSLVAVHLACKSLRDGECRTALAGGVNLALGPQFTMATTKMRMMAADGRCKTFDAAADGFVRGEGSGAVVLKRLSDAVRDGDTVLAVIRGSAVNQDGRTNGLTAPSGLSQQAILRQALRDAGVDPAAVGAVEAHGTGTALGDPIEVEALTEVFGPATADSTPIALASVKTNIGHLEAAAGIAGLIKVVLSLRHEAIPPHLHFRTLNPATTLDGTRFEIPTALRPWPRNGAPRVATVSSFGWSGTNGCLVVEEAPAAPPAVQPAASPAEERAELLPISARSPQALRALVESYRDLLAGTTDITARDVCRTAGVRRSHHPFRVAVTGRGPAGLADRLTGLLEDGSPSFAPGAAAPDAPAGPVFAFCGQGAQWAGMGRDLLDAEPVYAEALRRCDELFRAHADWSLLDEITADPAHSRLDRTEVAQPVLFATQVALAALWRSWGVEPEAVVGHSVGEIAAAHVAGVLSLEDAVRVAFHRGRVMQEAHGLGRMAAVALPADEAARLVEPYGDRLVVAAVNSPTSVVLAGEPAALAEVVEGLTGRGVFSRVMPVEYAFHSPQVEPLRAPLVRELRGLRPRPATVPIISTVTGREAAGDDYGAEYWGRNVREPVRFADALAALVAADAAPVVVEVGPQPVLARPVVEQFEATGRAGVVLASMRSGEDARTTLLTALGGLYRAGHAVDWQRLHPEPGRDVALPAYRWQRERHWLKPPRRRATTTAPVLHPLLGRRVRSALPVHENELGDGATAFLADHRVHGAALLPMTAYLELALAAGAGQVADLVLHEALVLPDDEPRPIQVALVEHGAGTSFRVFSQPATGEDDWTLHATGDVRPSGRPEGDRIDLTALRSRLTPVDVEAFHDGLREVGIDYGPAFRGAADLWRGEGEALGRVELPDGLTTTGYHWHPALLDACLQPVLTALPADTHLPGDTYLPADTYLPIGLDAFEPVTAPGVVVWSHARLREARAGTAVADVDLCDADGGLLARVRGLLLRRADRRSVLRQAEPDLFYEIAWEPLEVRPPEGGGTGAWLVVADRSGVGAELVDLLVSRGDRAELVEPGVVPADGGPWRGVVHLGSLDADHSDVGHLDVDHPGAGAADPVAAHERVVPGVLDLVRALTDRNDPPPRLWLVTRGAQDVGGTPVAVAQSPAWGLAQAIGREHPELRCTAVDLDPADPRVDRLHDLLRAAGGEDRIAIRDGGPHVPRLVPSNTIEHPAARGPVRLEVRERGVLENLVQAPAERRAPGPDEVEIRVHATGLNFRDVLNALGMYPGDPGPLGLECSGEVAAVGSRVEGFAPGDRVLALAPAAFGTFTTVAAHRVAHVPDALDHVAAATVPVAFLTAAHGLHHLARVEPGDRVLVHAAAGGVGLAAVQLAQRAGAEVFATASRAKWELLERRGVRHVFDSRTLDWAESVHRVTGGEGVDVVLNSLSGEFIPRGIGVLRPGGRFVEIGKRGTWDAADVARLRPDVEYHPFDLGVVADENPEHVRSMLHDLVGGLADGDLTPLPSREFPLVRAVDAFRFMAQARHVGKVVVVHEPRPAVRADATYLVTGGLGAIGLDVARWLVARGAGNLVLLGRTAPSPEVAAAVEDLPARVVVRRADVGDEEALAEVLAGIANTMPPLRGVVHAAGVLDDSVLLRQDWDRFERVLRPKVAGAWNLHRLTRDLPLDFFVLCSSAASLLGSAGQGAYVTANAFLDALAHHRSALGLAATSVNWGPWAGAGMAGPQRDRLAAQGFRSLDADQGTEALGRLIDARAVQVGVLPIDWPTYLGRFGDDVPPLFARFDRVPATQPSTAPGHGSARARIEAAHPGERRELVRDHVRAQAVKILGLPPDQPLNPRRPLRELGLDSLMAVELRNALGAFAGRSLPSTLVFEHPTLVGLADHLHDELFPQHVEPPPTPTVPDGERDLVARVAALDDEDVEALLAAKLSALDLSALDTRNTDD